MKQKNKFLLSLLAVALIVLPAYLSAQAPAGATPASGVKDNASEAERKSLLAAVDQWKNAVIAKDRAGLDRIFDEDLSYGHTTGEVLNKPESIDRVLSSKNTYTSIDLSDVSIRVYGRFALITAKTAFHITADGKETVSNLSGIDVWIQRQGHWKLLARQLTRPIQ
jgi:ketosteroid isomerase-like protein